MIVYLYGPDSYRRQRKAQFYLENFKKKHAEALSIKYFNLVDNGDFDELKSFVRDQSLFGKGFKFGIIHNVSEVAAKELKPILQSVFEDKTTTLIISEDKKLGKTLDTFLQKSFKPENFDVLSRNDFQKFMRLEAKERNVQLLPADEELLLQTHEGDSWGLVNQLEKLSLGGKAEATLRTPEMFPLMFQLTGQGPLQRKLSALAWLLEREEPAKVFNIIATQKNPAIKIRMADYDALIKSGKLEYEEVLTDLVLN